MEGQKFKQHVLQDIMILNMLIPCHNYAQGSAADLIFPLVAIPSFVISFRQGNLHLKKSAFLLFSIMASLH